MTTKTIECFKYSELSDEAKEKARDWYRRASEEDSFWSEAVLDDAEQIGKILGIDFAMRGKKPAIFYTGFWSQGRRRLLRGHVEIQRRLRQGRQRLCSAGHRIA